jgi:hypothetical protein
LAKATAFCIVPPPFGARIEPRPMEAAQPNSKQYMRITGELLVTCRRVTITTSGVSLLCAVHWVSHCSYLNKIWFAKIERDVIARGVFTSVPDLARKLRRYINAYSANAQPIRWKYSDVTHRIRSNDLAATGH